MSDNPIKQPSAPSVPKTSPEPRRERFTEQPQRRDSPRPDASPGREEKGAGRPPAKK